MIGSVPTNRRAHAFAQAVDEHGREADAEAADGDDPERPALLALAAELEALPKPELAEETRSVQRAQLVAAMEQSVLEGSFGAANGQIPEQRGPRTGRGQHRAPAVSALARLRPHTRLGRSIAAGGLGVGVAAGALSGAAVASTDALPGDSLYGLKRGIEDIRVDLAGDEAERGRLHLDNASTRMREARRLLERGRDGHLDSDGVRSVRRALSGMRHDAAEGHRLLSGAYAEDGRIGRMESLSTFSRKHHDNWSQLRDRLPDQLKDVSAEVSSIFEAIDKEVRPFRLPSGPDTSEGEDGGPAASDEAGRQDATRPEPSGTSSVDERTESPERSPQPSESGTDSRSTDGGLLGEGGLLDPSRPSHEPSAPGSDTDPGDQKSPGPEVSLPPVLPDLLPGLGGAGADGQRE